MHDGLPMYPMDFEEFLWATGYTMTADAIRKASAEKKPFTDAVQRQIMQQFRMCNVTQPSVTPDLFAEHRDFKFYMGDTGLLVT